MSTHAVRLILFLTVFEPGFFLQGATAQTATSTSKVATETLFLGPDADSSNRFSGSVVAAEPCMTTLGLDCTSRSANVTCWPWPVSSATLYP
jgi:hypothetical protein